jgi:predicted metalloendopeptidase
MHLASDILNNMDKDVDPCEDFYQFTCGSFLKNTVIPDDKTSVSQFSKISDELKEKLRILVQEKPEKTEIAPFTNLKHLYQSCLNKST